MSIVKAPSLHRITPWISMAHLLLRTDFEKSQQCNLNSPIPSYITADKQYAVLWLGEMLI